MTTRSYVAMLACAGSALAVVSAGAQRKSPAPRVAVACERACLNAPVDFKVSGGKMHEIEAMGFRADYQSPTGWETHAGH